MHCFPNPWCDRIAEQAESSGTWLGKILIENDIVPEAQIAQMLAKELKLPLIDMRQQQPDARRVVMDECRILPYALFYPDQPAQ